jgi:hypothetical protein
MDAANSGIRTESQRRKRAQAIKDFMNSGSSQLTHEIQAGGAFHRRPAVPLFELFTSTECAACGPGPLQEGGGEATLARYFDIKEAMAKVPNL